MFQVWIPFVTGPAPTVLLLTPELLVLNRDCENNCAGTVGHCCDPVYTNVSANVYANCDTDTFSGTYGFDTGKGTFSGTYRCMNPADTSSFKHVVAVWLVCMMIQIAVQWLVALQQGVQVATLSFRQTRLQSVLDASGMDSTVDANWDEAIDSFQTLTFNTWMMALALLFVERPYRPNLFTSKQHPQVAHASPVSSTHFGNLSTLRVFSASERASPFHQVFKQFSKLSTALGNTLAAAAAAAAVAAAAAAAAFSADSCQIGVFSAFAVVHLCRSFSFVMIAYMTVSYFGWDDRPFAACEQTQAGLVQASMLFFLLQTLISIAFSYGYAHNKNSLEHFAEDFLTMEAAIQVSLPVPVVLPVFRLAAHLRAHPPQGLMKPWATTVLMFALCLLDWAYVIATGYFATCIQIQSNPWLRCEKDFGENMLQDLRKPGTPFRAMAAAVIMLHVGKIVIQIAVLAWRRIWAEERANHFEKRPGFSHASIHNALYYGAFILIATFPSAAGDVFGGIYSVAHARPHWTTGIIQTICLLEKTGECRTALQFRV